MTKHLRMSLVAATLGLAAAAAQAQQTYNPTASDLSQNTAGGTGALPVGNESITGVANTAFGYLALSSLFDADKLSPGASNTAIGSQALLHTTIGDGNTASGMQAMYSNTEGTNNTASGIAALRSNTTGGGNTATGGYALYSNLQGHFNSADGYYALYSNTEGQFNTASGYQALRYNVTGNNNVAIGSGTLLKNTTGTGNATLGYNTMSANTAGNNNVAVGLNTLVKSTGNNNTAVGAGAGKALTGGSFNVYIAHTGYGGVENNTMRLGSVQTRTFLAGVAGVPLSGASVVITSSGQLGVVASSARYKQDIKEIDDVAGRLAKLRPVTYRYKAEPGAVHYGLVAEEVAEVMPEIVVRNQDNKPESVQYQELIPLLLQQVQKQREQNARLEAEVAQQREEAVRQKVAMIRQQAEIADLRLSLETRLAQL
ncbi:MAG: tail fiber domain-containing protein, partial [Solimonas sp.]